MELNGRLYLGDQGGSGFLAIDPMTGQWRGAVNFTAQMVGFSIAPSKNKIFARSANTSPGDIFSISLNADGSFGQQRDSPTHGSYPDASRTFVMPGEARVVDDAGIIYSADNLTYLGSLAGAFQDIAFAPDTTVVLRGNTLIAYSAALSELGRKTIAAGQRRVHLHADLVHAFALQNGRGVVASRIPRAEVVPLVPAPGIDPTSLSYQPDSVALGQGGVVYLMSKLHQSVFRWSIAQQKYLPTLSLTADSKNRSLGRPRGERLCCAAGVRVWFADFG
jgi:hypothetical protein